MTTTSRTPPLSAGLVPLNQPSSSQGESKASEPRRPPPSPFFAPRTPTMFAEGSDTSPSPFSLSAASQSSSSLGDAVSNQKKVSATFLKKQPKKPVVVNLPKETKSGLVGTTANLINAIVGSGIVGIPFAVRCAGLGAGIFLIVGVGILTEISLRLLIATAKHVHCPTYETTIEAAFGTRGFQFIAINMFVMAYGAMLSYLMIVKDSFSSLFGIHDAVLKRALLVLISLSIQVPLSCQRDMANLAKTSRFNVLIDTMIVFLVLYNAPIQSSLERVSMEHYQQHHAPSNDFEPSAWNGFMTLLTHHSVHWDTVFVGLGVLSFAYVCQHSAFLVAGSLERPSQRRWSQVTRAALCVCIVLALTCGMSGYLGFLDSTQGDILKSLNDSWSAKAARAGLGCTMLFVFPLECFVARHVCVVLLFQGRRAHEGDDTTILNRRDRRIGLTLVLYILALIPAATFEDLGPVLAVTGAISGSCLSYIGPGVIFLGVHGARFLELVEKSWFGSQLKKHAASLELPESFTLAVETTPLVGKKLEKRSMEQQVADDESTESRISEFVKTFAWYALLMPVWCQVAGRGKKGLSRHIHEMALKSPHPIRIGDVEYRMRVATPTVVRPRQGRGESVDPELAAMVIPPPGLFHSESSPELIGSATPTSGAPLKPVSINQQIGKNLVQRKESTQPLEKDPQQEPPGWRHFLLAIFFQIFGLVAFFAGILSLFTNTHT